MKLNKEELFVGYVYGAMLYPFIGPNSLLLGFITAVLWAIGGSYLKTVRRLGCPIASGIALIMAGHTIYLVMGWAGLSYLSLCVGYGTPSTQPPDDGSIFGRIVWALTGGSELLSTLITRGTILAFSMIMAFILF